MGAKQRQTQLLEPLQVLVVANPFWKAPNHMSAYARGLKAPCSVANSCVAAQHIWNAVGIKLNVLGPSIGLQAWTCSLYI